MRRSVLMLAVSAAMALMMAANAVPAMADEEQKPSQWQQVCGWDPFEVQVSCHDPHHQPLLSWDS